MDKEGLRRQLEDMEEAAERWRSERRRLNSEIDKLEAALAEAKAAGARKRAVGVPEPRLSGTDSPAVLKIQEAAENKIKKAAEEWEAERAKLKSQINRLEGAVADAIARASNPMRATQSVKEQFEVELTRALKEKTELEQAFLRSKTEWEQEKLKFTGEAVKLRRAAQFTGRPVPKDEVPEVNPKVRDLEEQLKQSVAKWNSEREDYLAQIHKLQDDARQWDAERRQLNDHAAHLQEAYVQSQAKIQANEVAARAPQVSEKKADDTKREKDLLQRQFQDAQQAWEGERRRLEQQLQRVTDSRETVSNEVVDQLRKQYEQRLQEAIQQKTQLAQELQNASAMLETERTRLSAAQTSGASEGGINTDSVQAEVARVEDLITEIATIIDHPETDLSTVIRKNVEKAELDSYLKGILFALGKTPK